MKKQLHRNKEMKNLKDIKDGGINFNISGISLSKDQSSSFEQLQPDSNDIKAKSIPNFNFLNKGKFINIRTTLARSKVSQQPLISSIKNQNGTIKKNLAIYPEEHLLSRDTTGGISKMQKLIKSTATSCVECSNKKVFQNIIHMNLCNKYRTARKFYNVKVINDIIYNDNTHLVCAFKDYLLCDDIEEFLKRFYNSKERGVRLNRIYDFYDKYSEVFPNYVILEARKYLLKNISRKQRVFDEQQKIAETLEQKKFNDTSNSNPKVLTTTFIREINNSSFEIDKKTESAKTQLKSYTKFQPRGDVDRTNDLRDITLKDLLEKFIQKDTTGLNGEIDDFDISHYTNKENKITPKKTEVKIALIAERLPVKRVEPSNTKKSINSPLSANGVGKASTVKAASTKRLPVSQNAVRNQVPLYRQSSEATRKVTQSNPRPVTAMKKNTENTLSKKFLISNTLKSNEGTVRNERIVKSTKPTKHASSCNKKERTVHKRSRSNKDLNQRDSSRKTILKDLLVSSLNKPKAKRLTPNSMPQSTKQIINKPTTSGVKLISTVDSEKGDVRLDSIKQKDLEALKVDISSLHKDFPELKKSAEEDTRKFKSEYLNSLNSKRIKKPEVNTVKKAEKKVNPTSIKQATIKAPNLNHSKSTEALKNNQGKKLRRVESKVVLTNCRTHTFRRQPLLKPHKVTY